MSPLLKITFRLFLLFPTSTGRVIDFKSARFSKLLLYISSNTHSGILVNSQRCCDLLSV